MIQTHLIFQAKRYKKVAWLPQIFLSLKFLSVCTRGFLLLVWLCVCVSTCLFLMGWLLGFFFFFFEICLKKFHHHSSVQLIEKRNYFITDVQKEWRCDHRADQAQRCHLKMRYSKWHMHCCKVTASLSLPAMRKKGVNKENLRRWIQLYTQQFYC